MDDLESRVAARMESEGLSWGDAWRLETAGSTADELSLEVDRSPDSGMVEARTRQIMSERSLDWKDGRRIAARELGARPNRLQHGLPSDVGWSMFVFGGLLVIVPTGISLVLWPGWVISGDSDYGDSGAAVWLTLLGVSGLVVFFTGTYLGWKKPQHGMEFAALAAMCGGVVIGVFVAVMGFDWQNEVPADVLAFVAFILAMFTAVAFWLLAGTGLVTGRLRGYVRRRIQT